MERPGAPRADGASRDPPGLDADGARLTARLAGLGLAVAEPVPYNYEIIITLVNLSF